MYGEMIIGVFLMKYTQGLEMESKVSSSSE